MSSTALLIGDFADTVGAMRSHAAAANHQQPGNPLQLAKALMALADTSHPPVRLPLGALGGTLHRSEAGARDDGTGRARPDLCTRVLDVNPVVEQRAADRGTGMDSEFNAVWRKLWMGQYRELRHARTRKFVQQAFDSGKKCIR